MTSDSRRGTPPTIVPYGTLRLDDARRSSEARTLIVSQRGYERSFSRALIAEFEDVAAAADEADVVAPWIEPSPNVLRQTWLRLRSKYGRRLLGSWHDDLFLRPRLDRPYDLVFVSCEDVGDLQRIGSVPAWAAAGRKSACYVHEVWAAHIGGRDEMQLLAHFDVVFVSCAGAVEPVRQLTGKPCHYLPPAVDAALFCPLPSPPPRCIDVYNMGRRSNLTHQALLVRARSPGFFYVYDTFAGNRCIVPGEHRALLANLVKRSKFFVANRAKVNEPDITARQPEVGARHFEGTAGGAVVIGEPLDNEAFRDLVGWEDAVVAMPLDDPDVVTRLAALERDQDRLAAIRRRNVLHCLQRHDWVHRWEQVLATMGLSATPALARRRRTLQALVEQIGA